VSNQEGPLSVLSSRKPNPSAEHRDGRLAQVDFAAVSPGGIPAPSRQSLRGLDWFEVTEVRGHINDGRVEHYQVSMKVGFRMDA